MATQKAKRSNSRRGDTPICLAAGLERSLSAYASAAAAGVSLAAMAAPAEAKIIYTPADTPINGYVSIDLNHDGIADFLFIAASNLGCCGGGAAWVSVGCAVHSTFPLSPPKGIACNYLTDQIWGRGVASGRFASALPARFKVRPNKSYFQAANYPFQAVMGVTVAFPGCSSYPCTGTQGQWLETRNRYLGLQFVIKGQVHYGWARLSVLVEHPSFRQRGIYAVLTGYAYEDVPNKPIITGKIKGPDVVTLDPATLGHLAGGASQIPAWRGARNRFGTLEGSRSKGGPSSQAAP
jgi:hypothetical protein